MMTYLAFFRVVHLFNLPLPGGHTNMLQMILTLKIIGFAFEKNSVATKVKNGLELTGAEKEICESQFMDVFHYCFNYIGLLTGPYYTYRTFYDYFNTPYSRYADCWQATLDRFKYIPFYALLFLGTSQIWPIEYATSEEFYDRSVFYRLFYVWPSFFIFRMRIYSGIVLAECVCVSAGFGAYPKVLESKCGHGATKEITPEILDKITECEYEFESIENVNVSGVESCLTFREGLIFFVN